jgi:predicted transcriptional regulator
MKTLTLTLTADQAAYLYQALRNEDARIVQAVQDQLQAHYEFSLEEVAEAVKEYAMLNSLLDMLAA